jgi:hypothetical protein
MSIIFDAIRESASNPSNFSKFSNCIDDSFEYRQVKVLSLEVADVVQNEVHVREYEMHQDWRWR